MNFAWYGVSLRSAGTVVYVGSFVAHCSETSMEPFIQPEDLLGLMNEMEVGRTLLVVDVRDADREDGWIKGSVHLPSADLDFEKMEAFARAISDTVGVCVFHCHFSQSRGPRAHKLFEMVAPRVFIGGRPAPRALILQGGWQRFQMFALTNNLKDLLQR
jgi:hypothetical protein